MGSGRLNRCGVVAPGALLVYSAAFLGLVVGGLILIVGGAYLKKKRRGIVEDMEADALWT